MLKNNLERFSETLFIFISGKSIFYKGLLVKRHSENLQTHGDFSFPSSLKSWHEFVESDQNPSNNCDRVLQYKNKTCEDLVEESKKWNLRVKNVKEAKGRVYLFLERPSSISVGLSEASRNSVIISQRLQENFNAVTIDTLCENTNSITTLRVKYLSKVIKNLCTICLDRQEKPPQIYVTSKSSSICDEGFRILCSTVLSAKTGSKEVAIDADEFVKLRQNEMTLIAQHKYGMRVATDSKWKEFLAHLGESAVAFELLQSKPTSAVKINFDNASSGASKGASFILYNCARLETIIKMYNDKVNEGLYPPLPEFEQVDFSLLTQEDEWNLIFNFIMGFPSLLACCVEIKDKGCEFRPHYICNFLCSMVRVFSQYYRRTRILVEPRTHLLPVIHARIHMLKILNDTLKSCLKILNIKSVSQM